MATHARVCLLQRELAPLKCDAFTEKHYYAEAIRGSNAKKEKLPFDLGHRYGPVFRITKEERDRQVAAYRAIRLSEVAGLPPSVNYMVVASDILKLAADRLSVMDPEVAARLILRVSNDDTHVLSRTRVATMPMDSVKRLVRVCNGAIEYALPRIAGGRQRAIVWIERLRVVLEALSRPVLRLDPEMAEIVFNQALEYYRSVIDEKPSLCHLQVRSLSNGKS